MTDLPDLLWSASTRGFYMAGISSNVPEDAVPVTPEEHATCLARIEAGLVLSPCPQTGKPIATQPAATPAAIRAGLERAIKAEARRRIEAVSPLWRQLNDLRAVSAEGAARFSAIDAIRAASNAIEELVAAVADDALAAFPVAANPLWPVFGDA